MDERPDSPPPGPAGPRTSRPVRPPDLAELETLVVCAAEGSLGAAAARLGISRPAVAKRIGNLEVLAGRPLLHRGGRGVRLTDAGATLLAGARRLLEERDVLLSTLADIRGEGPSPIAGLRDLLGHSGAVSRAAQQPEARLAETERVLELVLGASATGVIISNPETALVYEVNDAFCRFYGRSRGEIVGHRSTEEGIWYDVEDRARLLEEVREKGMAERFPLRIRRPDGSVRRGEATAHFVALAGTRQLLSTIDDVTEQHRLEGERTASIEASRATARFGARLLGGGSLADALPPLLSELRSAGEFRSVLSWDLARAQPTLIDGETPPVELEREIERARPTGEDGVLLLGRRSPKPTDLTGLALPLPAGGSLLVLLAPEPRPSSTRELFIGALGDIATLLSAAVPAASRV